MRHWPLGAGIALAVAGVPLALLPAGFNPFGPLKYAVLAASALLVLVGVALDSRAQTRVRDALRFAPVQGALVLGGLALLSSVVSADVRTALTGSYPGYESGLIAIVAAACAGIGVLACGQRGVVVLARALVFAVLVAGALAVAERMGFSAVTVRAYIDATRVRSTLGNAANLGLWTACALPWIAHVAIRDPERAWRIAAVAAGLAGGASIVFSSSRGAIVAVIAGAVVWWVLAPRTSAVVRRDRPLALVVVGIAIVALVAVASLRADPGAIDTAGGRVDVWRASAPLVVERPFLGWGPGGFGRAFVAHMPEALVNSAAIERALEDPHNVLVSAAVSSGPLGALVLLGVVVLTGRAAWRNRSRDTSGASLAAAASLGTAFVGLQFHFVTLEIAPLVFASIGVLAVVSAGVHGPTPAPEATRAAPGVAAAWWAASGVAALIAVATVALVVADVQVARGFEIAASGRPGGEAGARFAAAERLAPWESAVFWARGRAASDGIRAGDPVALADGLVALDRALELRPADSRIVRDAGDLLAVAALSQQPGPESDELLGEALERYDAVLALAPVDPLAWSGRGGTLLALGRTEEALAALDRAVKLSPRYGVGWENLALAREALGDAEGAAEAEVRAEELARDR